MNFTLLHTIEAILGLYVWKIVNQHSHIESKTRKAGENEDINGGVLGSR